MAKTLMNSALKHVRGRIDRWVYRQRNGQTVISAPPVFRSQPPTSGQLEARRRFRLASSYGRAVVADPVRRAVYAPLSEARGESVYLIAMADYLRVPLVEEIDASGYDGAIGQSIVINAVDDVAVVGVTVRIATAAGAEVESGPAELIDGEWRYVTTAAAPAGQTLTVTAVALDRPGNEGERTVTIAM